jgi:hypothetical protein
VPLSGGAAYTRLQSSSVAASKIVFRVDGMFGEEGVSMKYRGVSMEYRVKPEI